MQGPAQAQNLRDSLAEARSDIVQVFVMGTGGTHNRGVAGGHRVRRPRSRSSGPP